MTLIFALYIGLLLVSLITLLYSLYAYYECPITRSHRPYIVPIFVATGWIFLSIHGLAGGAIDKHSVAGLVIATLAAIMTLLHYYRRQRKDARYGN